MSGMITYVLHVALSIVIVSFILVHIMLSILSIQREGATTIVSTLYNKKYDTSMVPSCILSTRSIYMYDDTCSVLRQ